MGRHYETHHGNFDKELKKVVALDRGNVSKVQLFLPGDQREVDVVWCDNWREIAVAIVNSQDKPEPINPKAQYVGTTKDNRLKSRDRSGQEFEVAVSSRH